MNAYRELPAATEQNPAIKNHVAISVEDVSKSFPIALSLFAWLRYWGSIPRRTVLYEVSLRVRFGELFGLLGPNGAGKTTLLKMLATLCIPDRGRIMIGGVDARKQPMKVKHKIGLCTSEERSFYFRLTARRNLRFFGALVGLNGDQLEQRVEQTASLVDLAFALDRRFDSFSSGMRQRLALARALLGDPDIIFLDEPTRAVDPLHAAEIRRLIRDVLVTQQGKTAVLATNSLEEAWEICDTVAILHDGRIVANGSPSTLDGMYTRFLRFRITLEGPDDVLIDTLKAIPGVRQLSHSDTLEGPSVSIEFDPNMSKLSDLLEALVSRGPVVKSFRSEDPQPLDVFMGLTRGGG
jgi:ABC-2 type transport system ATP-binding protein